MSGKSTILLVDDSASVRLIVKACFTPFEVIFLEASTGREALNILKDVNVDLLILDYTMPSISGAEVIKEMENSKEMSTVPVILYTAGVGQTDVEDWLKRRTSAFLEKTDIGDDLIPTVKEILGSKLKRRTEL